MNRVVMMNSTSAAKDGLQGEAGSIRNQGNTDSSKGKGKLPPSRKAAAALRPVGGASHTGLHVDKISVFFTPPVFPEGMLCFRRFRGRFFPSLHSEVHTERTA